MKRSQTSNSMFLLLLHLFLVANMWNKEFWLIIAGPPPLYKRDGYWSSVYSLKIGVGDISIKKRERLLNSGGIKIAEWE